jgi:hypothetical protein
MAKRTKMKAKIKKLWLKALRSGEYNQAKGVLRTADATGYCCLGVLCDLHRKAMKKGKGWDQTVYRQSNGGVPPECVVAWAGLPAQNPDVTSANDDNDHLASLNDNGASFADIAAIIEEQL